MKIILSLIVFFMSAVVCAEQGLYHLDINSIDGKKIKLSNFKNKTLLIVNIATKCGYTPQLKSLEVIHKKYKGKGLVVIGVPSNDFGGQTPQPENKVKSFCELNYGVSFLLTKKTTVKGSKKHKIIEKLISMSNTNKEISWNFEKFLVNKTGKKVTHFLSPVSPTSNDFITALENELKDVL